MKQTIQDLSKMFTESSNVEEAAVKLSKSQKRLSKGAAKNVMLDIKDYQDEIIDETQLSLFLRQYGF